jgi:hypothetical protein
MGFRRAAAPGAVLLFAPGGLGAHSVSLRSHRSFFTVTAELTGFASAKAERVDLYL